MRDWRLEDRPVSRIRKEEETIVVSSDVFINGDDIELENVGEGLSRKILGYNSDLMMVRVFFRKGAVGEPHSHPHRQVTYVEKGCFEVEIGEKKCILKAGDSFIVPANIIHGCVALEDGALIDVFTPIREDFIAT